MSYFKLNEAQRDQLSQLRLNLELDLMEQVEESRSYLAQEARRQVHRELDRVLPPRRPMPPTNS